MSQPPLHIQLLLLREVAGSSLGSVLLDADVLNSDALTASRSDPDVNGLCAETSSVLEVVERLPLSLTPGLATVGGDLEALNSNIGVLDLHAEPVGAGSLLVLQDKGSGDAARNNVPANIDLALRGISELSEAGLIQVELVGGAAGALVHNHGGNLVAIGSGNGDTSTAVGGGIPVGGSEGGAEER